MCDSLNSAAQHIAELGAKTLLIVPADMPTISAHDIDELLERHTSGLSICPAIRDGGTNALVCSPPNAMPFQFGPDSARRHIDEAARRNVPHARIAMHAYFRDIDTPDDLAWLASQATRAEHAALSARGRHHGPARSGPAGSCDMTRSGIPDRLQTMSLADLLESAAALRDQGWGRYVSYSRKVFIPLTELCRDVCHYCTYAKTPKKIAQAYLSPEQVLAIARAGQAQGCKEALFTLGDKPELRYQAARDALAELGYASTVAYLQAMARLVLDETGLLPHLNPGVLTLDEYRELRSVAPSMGIMLESASARLCERGQPHFGSPDKDPAVRIQAIADAGEAKVPLTTGMLIGIGETRDERLESLLAIEAQHQLYGHIQEIIIQNFVPKPGTKMHAHPRPISTNCSGPSRLRACCSGRR